MTRPGGPAEPPGPSAGEGIVQEWGLKQGQPPSDWDDLARRIDAALAEVARDRNKVVEMAAARVTEIAAERDAGGKTLSEREAQIARLSARFEAVCWHVRSHGTRPLPSYLDSDEDVQEVRHELARLLQRASLADERSRDPNPPCAGCGGPHPFDTTLPSPLWNRVIRAAGLPDYLCTTCIVQAFVRADESFEAELYGEPVNRPGSVAPHLTVRVDERALDDSYGSLQYELRTSQAALAEREAQIAALRSLLIQALRSGGWDGMPSSDYPPFEQALTSTADAAGRCIERAKAEGAEEMRERAARIIRSHAALHDHPGSSSNHLASECAEMAYQVIRALDAGDPAARRG